MFHRNLLTLQAESKINSKENKIKTIKTNGSNWKN